VLRNPARGSAFVVPQESDARPFEPVDVVDNGVVGVTPARKSRAAPRGNPARPADPQRAEIPRAGLSTARTTAVVTAGSERSERVAVASLGMSEDDALAALLNAFPGSTVVDNDDVDAVAAQLGHLPRRRSS